MNKILSYLLDKEIIISNELKKIVNLKESSPALTLEKYQEIQIIRSVKKDKSEMTLPEE